LQVYPFILQVCLALSAIFKLVVQSLQSIVQVFALGFKLVYFSFLQVEFILYCVFLLREISFFLLHSHQSAILIFNAGIEFVDGASLFFNLLLELIV
jgi:hypothetical protein